MDFVFALAQKSGVSVFAGKTAEEKSAISVILYFHSSVKPFFFFFFTETETCP